MCEFISAARLQSGKLVFLTNKNLETKRGKELREYLGDKFDEDVKGHGALAWYKKWTSDTPVRKQVEYTHFSDPSQLPPEIVEAIKECRLSQIGVPQYIYQLLTPKAMSRLRADAELDKLCAERDRLYAELKKADAELKRLGAERDKTERWKGLDAERDKLYAELDKLFAERDKLDAERKRLGAELFWNYFANPQNRVEIWK